MTSSPSFRPEIYAIDFGTSNSLLAAANAEATHPAIPLDPRAPDPTVLRSIIFFPDADQCFLGQEALAKYMENEMEGRFIRSMKRKLPVRSFGGTTIGSRHVTLEDLVAAFLREIKRRADAHFGADVRRVVFGRPAMYANDRMDDSQAQSRMERAARVAGFDEIHFCPEPVAAAREFRLQIDSPRTVLVADFGGGTSDFTVLRLRPEGYSSDDVLTIGGINLAGDALDGSIMRHRLSTEFGADVTYVAEFGSNPLRMPVHFMEKLCSPADLTMLRDRDTLEFFRMVRTWSLGPRDKERIDRLFCLIEDQLGFAVFESIETLKRALSGSDRAELRFDYPTINLREEITRAEFESYADREIRRILGAMDETVEQAGIPYSEIDLVCLTGGTAKVPRIARGIRERLGASNGGAPGSPTERMREFRNFHSVVGGLAEHARDIARR